MKNNKTLILVVSIVACEMAGFIGSAFTTPAIPGWYDHLEKPLFTPPGWIIGVVWMILFLLMGISLYLVWTSKKNELTKKAVWLFILQMVLNIWWSVLFFGMQSPMLAFVEIIFLWLAILSTMVYFYRISFWSGVLLLPYIFWVSFAAFLNFVLWRLN